MLQRPRQIERHPVTQSGVEGLHNPDQVFENQRLQLLDYIKNLKDDSLRGKLLELLMLCEKKYDQFGIHIAASYIHEGIKSGKYPAPIMEKPDFELEIPVPRQTSSLGSLSTGDFLN